MLHVTTVLLVRSEDELVDTYTYILRKYIHIRIYTYIHTHTLTYMYPILEYSSTYLILEYYVYFHTNTLYIYPVFL